jgi:hypothetical protein
MSAWEWLAPQIADAPDQLREHMRAAVEQASGDPVQVRLANAASLSLRAALQHPASKSAALDLLAADALLTHACAAAAEAGEDELARFTALVDAQYFQDMLDG